MNNGLVGTKKTKKTKGRVKIKIEFIENKLRRYTTFSKRKTGIMKKAHELSTLTGAQVMLVLASETGHLYTFATQKFDQMISKHENISQIVSCLNLAESGDQTEQRNIFPKRVEFDKQVMEKDDDDDDSDDDSQGSDSENDENITFLN